MNLDADPINLIVCGVGGQGNILISRMIGRILADKGYHITIGETFGAAQRGGAVHSSMRISKKRFYGPLIPKGKGHIILSLEPLETLRILSAYGNSDVLTISNTQPIHPVGVAAGRSQYPDLDELQAGIQRLSKAAWFLNVSKMAVDLGSPIVANIILLGSLVGIGKMPLTRLEVGDQIRTSFPPAVVELNLRALLMGIEAVSSQSWEISV
jgi:indolepyruvate ferredoxin oxidoreductase, beta subunit